MTPFPWRDAIGFGLGVLRLAPKDFWAMTPREFAHAVAAVRGDRGASMDRSSLDALMSAYPDKSTETRS